MAKNPFGKSRDAEKPYAIYKGANGFEWRVLKTYRKPENEDQYSRWFVSATSDLMFEGSYEYGDTYKNDIIHNGTLVYAEPEWQEHYENKPYISIIDNEEETYHETDI
jgi:hypothetical protein